MAFEPALRLSSLLGLGLILLAGLLGWLASLKRRDVSLVDVMWGPLIVLPALVTVALAPAGPRAAAVLALALAWALRLAGHIAWRHRGQPEDRRYAAMRSRHGDRFPARSLVVIFWLQGVLAWVVAAPLVAAVAGGAPWGMLDTLAIVLVAGGLLFEAVADAQLAAFKADRSHEGRVLDTGLWRYSRHPNYFGECCLWWGFFLFAASAGAWWTVVSPLLMTVLLLRVSGVTLLEKDIAERRPAYRGYVARTNAFIPGRPRP